MMILEALLEIQLVLLHTLVDGVHLLLHRSDGLRHEVMDCYMVLIPP
jgi:hypothetical protein